MTDIADFSSDELLRYARHLTLPGIGIAGQQKLKAARVLLVGAGGLGSPAALYLAAAGVGTLGIVDNDVVDLSNLQRQVLHETPAVGERKTRSASRRVAGINPDVHVETFDTRLSAANAREIIRGFDLVLDGSDNFPTRYLVNDACVLEGKPLVSGSILRFEGQLSLFATPHGPCYRCLFAEPPAADLVPSCADAGVLGVLPGVIGTLQALEAIKWIVGLGRSAAGRLLVFDALELRLREVAVRRDPACVVCGDAPELTELIDYEAFCGAPQFATADAAMEVEPAALARALATAAPPFVLDVREAWEFALGHLPDAHLVPIGDLPARLAELPRHRELVTVCHHGGRSLSARALLIRAGFSPVRSLAGGMDAWAVEIDHEMKRY
jgi:molybdopterin/thiamine biosynthesis adenylyltransferase/rhodanese-related sulfurtransferase